MVTQHALFPEMEEMSTESEPRGFRYRGKIMTEAGQAALVESIRQLDLKPFEFHGYLGNRRVVSFGLKYDYSRRSVEPASERPAFLDDLLIRVADFAGTVPQAFRQVGVSTGRERESGGTRTSGSLESSLECRFWHQQPCGSGEQMAVGGQEYPTP
jgi:hypothetical protein